MPEYQFIVATLYTVEAESETEAWEKYYAGHASEQSSTVEMEEQ
jgi:hypothetical protein